MIMTAPRLRFGSFKGSWERKTLAELGNFKRSYSLSRDSEGAGEYHHIHYGDIHSLYKGIVDFNSNIPSITAKGPFECASDGDVIFADASEDYKDLGKAVVVVDLQGKKVISGLHTHRFRPTEKLDPFFLLYFSQTSVYQSFVRKMGTGISVLGISKTNLSSLNIALPQIKEQQKIGSFFLLLDKKIDKQQEKIEQLELFKKGMMQKIFSREIRFKDENGNEYPDWIKVKFGSISKKVGPKNTKGFKYPVYSISNKHGFIPQDEQFEESRLENLDKSSYRIVKKGQFAYNPARINVGSIGLSNFDDPIIVSSLYVCFQLTGSVDNGFVAQYFKTNMFRKEVLRNVEGSVREYLFYENFSNINVWLPTIEEQRKISSYLSLLDLKIEKETTKLNTLLELKKGFLHEMFV